MPRATSIHATRDTVCARAATAGRNDPPRAGFETDRSLLFLFLANMLRLISRNCAIKPLQVAERFEKSELFLLLRW
jgi:hypothetical protein